MRLRGLCKLSDGGDWQWEKQDLALMGRAMLSKNLIGLSVDEDSYSPSLLDFWPEVTQPSSLQAL